MAKKVKVKVKKSKQGGIRKTIELPYATQRLLKVIWDKEGGPTQLEKKTGFTAQKFIHWRNWGNVSYRAIGKLAHTLGYSHYVFDFAGMNNLYPDNPLDWDVLLDSLDLTKEERAYVDKGKTP